MIIIAVLSIVFVTACLVGVALYWKLWTTCTSKIQKSYGDEMNAVWWVIFLFLLNDFYIWLELQNCFMINIGFVSPRRMYITMYGARYYRALSYILYAIILAKSESKAALWIFLLYCPCRCSIIYFCQSEVLGCCVDTVALRSTKTML